MSAAFDLARIAAHDVRIAVIEMDDEPWRNAKTIFPAVWCEWASIAVAEVLAHRDLGEWTFISAETHRGIRPACLSQRSDREGGGPRRLTGNRIVDP